MSTIAGMLRERRMRRTLRERSDDYATSRDPDTIRRTQLVALNQTWARATLESPHYAALKLDRGLPARFDSLEQFSDCVPALTRSDIQAAGALLSSTARPPEAFRVTGGSTAQPVRIPQWRSETAFTEPDMWVARSWHGITPRERCFLMWGHSHRFGSGLGARLKSTTRKVKDAIVGYRRFSAYDLDERRLREAADSLIRFKPDYVIGYSVALSMFADANRDRAAALRDLRLKLVIATAESFPYPEASEQVSAVFGCPVAMEYGCVECGVLAHTTPSGGFRTMWKSHLIEAIPGSRGHRVIVSSLFPRCTPLLRYELGDEIDVGLDSTSRCTSVLEFSRLIGRSNASVKLPSGRIIHSEAFTHAIRAIPGVGAYQVLSRPGFLPKILLVTGTSSTEDIAETVRTRLARLEPELAAVEVIFENKLRETRAGKRPMVLPDQPDSPGR